MTGGYSRVLVTGGAGFIGSHIVERFLMEDHEVIVLDNLSTGFLSNISHLQDNKNLRFVREDIRNMQAVEALLKDVDVVSHHAGCASASRSVEDPIGTNDINVTGTLNLLRASVKADVERFIYASSSSVYGDTTVLPQHENLVTEPVSIYGVSKMAAEYYSRVFHEVYGLETLCLRYFNVYGPRQSADPYSGVITIFINQLLEDTHPTIFGDGKQTRDFIHVQDVVTAHMLALECEKGLGSAFNIATGIPITVNKLAELLVDITGKPHLQPNHAPARAGDIRHSYGKIDKAEKTFGFRPAISIREGLVQLYEWFMKKRNQTTLT